jgi:predicted enzyme related to lactoylglutathione lyase
MKALPVLFLLAVWTAGCRPLANTGNQSHMGNESTSPEKASAPDTTPKVTGIGGIFFFSDDVAKTKEWYGKNLGLEINDYGSTFETRNANRPDEVNYLEWSPFKKGSKYFAPSSKDFMINYRVQNIEGLVKKLKANGVTIVDSIEAFDYGKFVHIMDHEGNKIELWEPVDHILTKLGGKTTK